MSTILSFLFVLIPILTNAQQPIDTQDCGIKYGCFKTPLDCKNTDCDYVIKWKDNGSQTDFIIGSKILQSKFYLAIGFSNDRKMGDDCVVMCKYSPDSSRSIEHYYNPKKQKTSDILDPNNPTIGLTNSNVTVVNNYLVCSFKREKTIQNVDEYFDLNRMYYLLLAKGYLDPDNEPLDHKKNKGSSSEKIDFNSIKGPGYMMSSLNLIKVHGIVMIATWVFLSTFGILFARYYKYLNSDRNIFSVQLWFLFHRSFMVLVPILSIAGFIIVLYANDWKWTSSSLTTNFIHSIIGIITIGLTIIQPIYAVFRPGKDKPNRPIFNWIHRIFGILIYISACSSIMLGAVIFLSGPKWVLFAGWMGWLVLVIFLLEISEYKIRSNQEVLEPLIPRRSFNDETPKNNSIYHKFKSLMMIIHLIVSIIIVLGMTFLVAIESQDE